MAGLGPGGGLTGFTTCEKLFKNLLTELKKVKKPLRSNRGAKMTDIPAPTGVSCFRRGCISEDIELDDEGDEVFSGLFVLDGRAECCAIILYMDDGKAECC